MKLQEFHKWEPTGVTGYPITHPIVGQTNLYRKLKPWLPMHAGDQFAHVFAAVAPWGVGKSRLGYEIVAQVNDTSKGWKVRDDDGALVDAQLFDCEETREQHLALYIRYSQVAHRQLNLDNWFAPAVYKALTPLASERLDTSIQHRIAKQARDRLEAEGFDPAELASAMELGGHEGEGIYTDTELATRLCNAAYDVLSRYGIRHVIVVLDELETAAERATGGMEAEEARTMDGKSITMLRKAVESLGRGGGESLGREDIEMMSKAVKEEDARARLPWLRFVALCSPAIGDELKEVQSTDRRFEIVDLATNAFSDVSTFVRSLAAEGRLFRPYPPGLVEAAYMMSGANFGWFNVVMAVVDQVLQRVPEAETPSLAWVFRRAIDIQERIGRHVLDHRAFDEVELDGTDRVAREAAEELLFGQQPLPWETFSPEDAQKLLAARNVHGEPLALRYHRVRWRKQDCMQTLVRNRFQRQSGTSQYTAPGIPEPLDLERLLDDLATLAVRDAEAAADGEARLLLPGSLPDFLQLLDLVHPHPASEETGRTLWTELMGVPELFQGDATHIGPSVEMLRRLDIRLRKASVGTVLRDPDENDAFTSARDRDRPEARERAVRVLTGALRLLDKSWDYDPEPAGFGDGVAAIKTPRSGLADFKELWLHPKGQAVLASVASMEELETLAVAVARDHRKRGRYPVLAFTSDYGLPERFEKAVLPVFQKARDSVVVVHLNSGEESALRSVGLPTDQWQGFRLRQDGFTTRFAERLNRIRAPIAKRVREWRHEISRRGVVAWPIRPNGTLKEDALKRLVNAWQVVMLEHAGIALGQVGAVEGFDYQDVLSDLEKLGLSPAAAPKGYSSEDTARLWVGQDSEARPEAPPFLVQSIVLKLKQGVALTQDEVKSEWFWGYTWDGNRPSDIFRQWLVVAVDLGWARSEEAGKKKFRYVFAEREELEGKLQAAENWLHGPYRQVVQRLSEVLGPGATEQWFTPGKGSKYQKAVSRLQEAAGHLDQLGMIESRLFGPGDPEEARRWFVEATRLRLTAGDMIAQVFDRTRYEDLPADLDGRMLHLFDENLDRPLWERIRQAEHFVDAVQRTAQQIRRRVPNLGDEMRARVEGIASFPINLFTRPLSTILHIVDDGLTGDDPEYSTGRAQDAKPDTLAYYLKELRVAEAMESLRGLAREVGVGETSREDVAFDDVEGAIASGFRDLMKRYAGCRHALDDLDTRVRRLDLALADAPRDLTLPADLRFDDVRRRPELIAGELAQSVDDEVEDLLENHDKAMKLGRFDPLMREAQATLLDSPERSVKGLEGKVRTFENAVAAFQEDLLEDAVLRRHVNALNVLRMAKGQARKKLPESSDLRERSLSDARIHVDGLLAGWSREGDELLRRTGVPFAEWLDVVDAVREQRDPALPAARVDALLAAGFLRRTFALGGTP